MSSQKNVPDARSELEPTLTRPALYYLIFVWQGLSFLKIFLVSSHFWNKIRFINYLFIVCSHFHTYAQGEDSAISVEPG